MVNGEFSSLEGYKVKDKTAREGLATLESAVQDMGSKVVKLQGSINNIESLTADDVQTLWNNN